jgi:hypothetical protein
LLDRHLAAFDAWLQVEFKYRSSPRIHYYLAVVTLLDQLNPKEFNWQRVLVILQHQLPFFPSDKFLDLFDEPEANIELSRIVSKFLMDRKRAGSFWVNSEKYADLAMYLLKFLCDK